MSSRHLYVHVPFCTRKCSYCDFAIAVRKTVPADDFLRGLAIEVSQIEPAARGVLETVYLGGGTPSKLGPSGVTRVLDIIGKHFTISPDCEVTIEANPEDVSQEAARAWANSGVNRVSIGIQSFDGAVLRWMHRVHDGTSGERAVRDVRDAGIDNISLDLIFALPAELDRSWKSDLERALELEPDHISLYGLTVERGTPLGRWEERGTVAPAGEDLYADEFLLADAMTGEKGYRHYEVSNFARPGKESRHNSAYWSGASYIGVGPSAHSYDGATRRWNVREYAEWMRRLDTGQQVVGGREVLTPENRRAETVYLGLRTTGGLAPAEADLGKARDWAAAGWAKIDDGVVRLTPEGWLRLDALAAGLTGF